MGFLRRSVTINRQECYLVPDQVCKSEPITKCSEVPKQICHVKHKRVPVRVSKTVPKKTCNVPDHYPPSHHTNTINEFVPPHVPAAVVSCSCFSDTCSTYCYIY